MKSIEISSIDIYRNCKENVFKNYGYKPHVDVTPMRALINSKAKSIGRIKDMKKIAAWMRTTYSCYCTVKKHPI